MSSPYADHVLADGASHYWRFTETTGQVLDSVGTAPGTITGTVTRGAPGALLHDPDPAVGFTGAGGVTLPPIAPPLTFTIEAWIRAAAADAAAYKFIWTSRSYAFSNNPALFSFAGSITFSVGGVGVESHDVPVDDGLWHHLVASSTGTRLSLYIDGVPVVVRSISAAAAALEAGHIGTDVFSGPSKITIDEVAISTVLSASTVAAHFALRAAVPPPPPRGALVAALRDRLLTLPAVTEVVADRIYTLQFPQSLTAPALRLQEIDRVSAMHLRGVVEIVRARVQVDTVEEDSHGDPYARAHALAHAVRGELASGAPSGLAGFRGDLSGIPVAGILADDQRERYDAAAHLVRIEQDFIVWFAV